MNSSATRLARATAIMLVALLAPSTSALASWPGENGRIAYLGGGHIYDMSPSGGGVRRLTPPGSDALFPSYSPDGEWIAFERNLGKRGARNFDIFIMAADGSSRRRLTRTEHYLEWFPSFSPSGSRILFARKRDGGTSDLFVMRTAGSSPRRITSSRGHELQAQWSPDGDRIAYLRGRSRLTTIAPDGSGKEVVAPEASGFDWNPNGDRFVIRADFGDGFLIYTIGEGGRRLRQVTTTGHWHDPVWSPNGRWVIAPGPGGHLYRMRPSGEDRSVVKRNMPYAVETTWQSK